MESLEEMVSQADQDSLDRKVTEDTPAPLVHPPLLIDQSLLRKENLEPLVSTAFLVSLDQEVTRVCQVCLVVRVCLDSLVLLSRAKDSLDSLDFQGGREAQASQDQRVKLESWDSLACLDQGVTMVPLVFLEILENLVVLVAKVNLEILLVILEVLEPKVSQEIQASQVDVAMMAPLVTTVFQDLQVSPQQREPLEKVDALE